MAFEVTIINPREGTMAKPKRDAKGHFVKKTKRKPNPKKRRRSSGGSVSTSPAPRRKGKRRRRNPDGGGGGVSINAGMRDILPVLAARFFTAYVARTWLWKWGNSMFTGAAMPNSPYQGQAWPFGNYAATLVIGYFAAKMLQRWKGAHFASIFWKTIVADSVTRMVWTEAFTRIPGAQNYFGSDMGTVYRDASGNTWRLDQYGRWQSMMGLETARPLDGELDWARPLDGLVGARGVDRSQGGYGGRVHMQGFIPEQTTEMEAAKYAGSATNDRYAAIYQ